MKLYSVIKTTKARVLGNLNLDISGIYHNHEDVKPNGLFFCLKGTKVNGEDFIESAKNNGAVAIVVEKEQNIKGITQIIVHDARIAMSLMSAEFYSNPAKQLKLIGVTGTNGKTTTTHIFESLFSSLGKKSAIIGTNGVVYNGKTIDTGMTTPDPIELNRIFLQLVKADIEYVFMEVSAHAMALKNWKA